MAFGDDFTGFKLLAHRLIVTNELGSYNEYSKAYQISYVGVGDSGFSFGQCQFDLYGNTLSSGKILKEVLVAYGLTEESADAINVFMIKGPISATGMAPDGSYPLETTITISWLDGRPDTTTTIGAIVNAALGSEAGQNVVNNRYEENLDADIAFINSVVGDSANDVRVTTFFSTAGTHSDMAKVFLLDYHNQLRISQNGAMDHFLEGEYVSFGAESAKIVGDSLGFDDFLNAYFSTTYAVHASDGNPQIDDLCRRFNNVVNLSYPDGFTPIDEEEAKGLLRVSQQHLDKYYDDEYLADLLTLNIDHREHLDALRQSLIAPTKNFLISHDQAVIDSGIEIDGAVVVGEDSVSMERSSGILDDNDVLEGTLNNDLMYGESGRDILLAVDGQDFLYGGEGDDGLFGGVGNDRLEGGTGNDYLLGGEGVDEYHYHSGDGYDTIIDADGQAVIYFDGIRVDGGELVAGLNNGAGLHACNINLTLLFVN